MRLSARPAPRTEIAWESPSSLPVPHHATRKLSLWNVTEKPRSVGADVGIVLGRRLAAEGDPEEVEGVCPGGLEHALFFQPAARRHHLQPEGKLDPADLGQAHGH